MFDSMARAGEVMPQVIVEMSIEAEIRSLRAVTMSTWMVPVLGKPQMAEIQLVNLVLSQVGFLWSALCYKYMGLHAAFAILLVCVALYNASARYHWEMTKRYSRAVRKALDKIEKVELQQDL